MVYTWEYPTSFALLQTEYLNIQNPTPLGENWDNELQENQGLNNGKQKEVKSGGDGDELDKKTSKHEEYIGEGTSVENHEFLLGEVL